MLQAEILYLCLLVEAVLFQKLQLRYQGLQPENSFLAL